MRRNILTTTRLLLVSFATLGLLLSAGCGKKKGGDKKDNRPPPEKPSNGSPIAAKLVKIHRDGADAKVEVALYNFGDKTAGGYVFLARFFDKDGKVIKRKKGTPFERDYFFSSLSGGLRNQCEPKKWVTLKFEFFLLPKEAVKAELLVSRVQAVDGMKLVKWWAQENPMAWPKGAAKKPAK